MMMLNERMHFHELIRSLVLLCKITRWQAQFERGKETYYIDQLFV